MRWVTVATAGAGILAYVVVLVAARVITAEQFATFIVLWSLWFTTFATMQGFLRVTAHSVRRAGQLDGRTVIDVNKNGIDDAEELVIASNPLGLTVIEDRTVDEIRERPALPDSSHPEPGADQALAARPLVVAWWAGALLAALAAAFSPAWGPVLLSSINSPLAVLLFSLAAGITATQAAFGGLLSGTGRWQTFSTLLFIESAVRVAVVIAFVLFGDALTGLMYAAIAGAVVTPVALLTTRAGRECRGLRGDLPLPDFLMRAASALAAAAVPSVLIVGAPALIRFLRPDIDALVLGNLFFALVVIRGVVLTPVTSFQNAVKMYFRQHLHRGRAALLLPLGVVAAAGVPVSLLLWVVSPILFEFFGASYLLSGDIIGQLAIGAVVTAGLYVTSAAVRAHSNELVDLLGWAAALIVTATVLLAVPDPLLAVTVSLVAGPAFGMFLHLVAGFAARPHGLNTEPGPRSTPEPQNVSH